MNGGLLELLASMMGSVVLRLPVLIAVCISLVWVAPTPRGSVRTVALWGLSLLGAATLLGLVSNVGMQVLADQGAYETMVHFTTYVALIHFALGLVEALAVVLLVWALTRVLRDRAAPRASRI